jgi:hypothetical protein
VRFLTDCVSCGAVVVPADAILLAPHAETAAEGIFDCPVCDDLCMVPVSSGARSALIARGATVVSEPAAAVDGALSPAHLAELRRVLADDDACRRMLDEAR